MRQQSSRRKLEGGGAHRLFLKNRRIGPLSSSTYDVDWTATTRMSAPLNATTYVLMALLRLCGRLKPPRAVPYETYVQQ